MPRPKAKTTIVLENENALRKLTPSEGWEIVHSAALATRAAIDQYVEPRGREKAFEVVCRLIRSPLPKTVHCREKIVNLKEDMEWSTIMYG
jgi:hypothetical protein